MSKLSFGSVGRVGLASTLAACAALAGCSSDKKSEPGTETAHDYVRPGEMKDVNADGMPDRAIDIDGDGRADGWDTDGDGEADVGLDGTPLDAGMSGFPHRPDDNCDEATNPYCGSDAGAGGCGGETFDLRPVGVNVMIAVDGSNSMGAFWSQMQQAIKQMIEKNPGVNFGVHLFWGEPVDNIIDGITRVNFCGQTQNQVLDVAPKQQTKILQFMGPMPPGQGNQFFDFTPVVEPLNYYLENKTKLENEKTTNYLVFISDGNDNCFGTAFAGGGDKNLAYEKIAVELGRKHVRVLPIGFDASSQQMAAGGGMVKTNYDALNTLAKFGGTGLNEALAADDPKELDKALETVGQAVRPCRFQIPAALDPTQNLNPFELSFFLGGTKVPRDRKQHEGWNFVEGNTSEVEFFGKACKAVQAGAALNAQTGCETNVCGQAATKVTTKPRAVEFLLDSSGSMATCSKDGLACLPKPLGNDDLTWWGVAARAISSSVVTPINDDVQFGLQEFPAIGTGFGACDVAPQPEVAPNQGTAITIIGSMLADLPTGSTPLVKALETVATNPGKLASKGVESAVVVISDGGNSQTCGGFMDPQGSITDTDAVTRLGTAAAALKSKKIKTFAVRFGDKGSDFPQQDPQLRSIVANGGTAIGDPNDPNNTPYLDAPDEAGLNKALDTISQGLASCKLTLGEFDSQVDKDKVNLYVNGEAVALDPKSKEGFNWSNDEKTEIELFGKACTAFKTNRVTSIVIEFGCMPLVIK